VGAENKLNRLGAQTPLARKGKVTKGGSEGGWPGVEVAAALVRTYGNRNATAFKKYNTAPKKGLY